MKYVFFVLIFPLWTQAQVNRNAHTNSSSLDRSYEMTYEDLAQELALKKKEAPVEKSASLLGGDQNSWSIGYAFAAMQYQFPTRTQTQSQDGLDFRLSQSFANSDWDLEGSLKKLASTQQGSRSADSEVLAATMKTTHSLPDGLSYSLGAGSSFNWIHTHEMQKNRTSLDWVLRGTAGLQGRITSRYRWGFEVNVLSPLSAKILKGGIETGLLISSSM